MKTQYLKMNWLIPVLGMVVVADSLVAGSTYLKLERRINSEEALTATLDRLYQDQRISSVLKSMHNGELDGELELAMQRLDLLLCGSILKTDAEMDSADVRTRIFAEDAFRRIALLRPMNPHSAVAGSAQDCCDDQSAAQRILELALASDHSTQAR
jgi:hypothetical protein